MELGASLVDDTVCCTLEDVVFMVDVADVGLEFEVVPLVTVVVGEGAVPDTSP